MSAAPAAAARRGRVSGVLDFTGEERRGERLGRRVGGVEDHQAARPQERLQPSGKGLYHADARRVCEPYRFEERRTELGGWQRRGQHRRRGACRVVQPDACHGAFAGGGRIVERDGHPVERGVEHATRLDLVPVMVLGVNPEHGDRRDAVLGGSPLRQAEGGQRLEQREQRAAKQPRLLAGDDRDRLGISQPLRRGERVLRRRARPLLRQDEVGDGVTLARVPLRARDGVAPCRPVRRIAGIEVGDARIVERVVAG